MRGSSDGGAGSDQAAHRGEARGGARHRARAVLRPRVRARSDPVHRADGGDTDLGGARPGALRARRAVVVVGRLCVADERRRSRGRCGADRDLRGDGCVPRCGARRAPRLRGRRARVRLRVRARPRRPHLAVHDREPRRSGPAAVRDGARGKHGDRRLAPRRGLGDRRFRTGRALGGRASPATSASRFSSSPRAGG